MSNVKDFLKRKDIVITPQRYLIEALGAMAQGLFASLLIGTIIKTLGQQTGLDVLVDLGGYATAMSGPAMACAIGWALHCPPLVLFSLITVGYSANALGGAGGPLAVLIIAIVASELGKAVSKETRVDILVTPLVTIFSGVGLSMLIAAPIGAAASQVGTLIMWATEQAPLVMGILVSVIVGVALTLPISSAAICAALGLTGLAGGAAVAGCCAQMIGFAVMSYKENGVGGLVSQGLGTSMLQMGNIVKNPRIWIAPTLASAITGPLATCVFHFEMNGAAVSSGMGTCGLVGQIGVYTGWVSDIAADTTPGRLLVVPGLEKQTRQTANRLDPWRLTDVKTANRAGGRLRVANRQILDAFRMCLGRAHPIRAAAMARPTSALPALPPRSAVRGAPLPGCNTASIAFITASCASRWPR